MQETVLITGASGVIGRPLTALLQQNGYNVIHIGRKAKETPVKCYAWDVERGTIAAEAIAQADHIIHLAGAPITEKRLDEQRKKEVIDSRVKSAELLLAEITRQNKTLKSFTTAAAVGFYGMVTSDKIFVETDPPATDFLGECCRLWEAAATPASARGIRTVIVRVGIVLAATGGALPQMAAPVRKYIGSPLGSGKQWVPWIHLDDICGIFLKAIQDNTMQGIYNGTAPNPVTNRELTKAIGRAINKPVFMPAVPEFVLKIILGSEIAKMVCTGSRASCEKIEKAGYAFQYTDVNKALQDLIGK